MARGFDSKSVAEQQEEKERARERTHAEVEIVSPRRRSLELARSDLVRRLEAAPESRREPLHQALAALDDLIAQA